ncbi:MAG: hypothetical protein R2779_05875 [Crocinitomicaceae bacterium]
MAGSGAALLGSLQYGSESFQVCYLLCLPVRMAILDDELDYRSFYVLICNYFAFGIRRNEVQ